MQYVKILETQLRKRKENKLRMKNKILKIVQTEFTNPIRKYKEVDAEIRRLEKLKRSYRSHIISLMDEAQSDAFSFDEYKEERKLVVQNRIDKDNLKAILGDNLPSVQSEISFVKITVI